MTRRPAPPDAVPIRCPRCELPAARIVGDALVIVARHHGEHHVVELGLADLVRLLGEVPKVA